MKHSIFHWIFKLKYVFALAVFVGVIGFVGESSIVNRIGQQQEISRLKGEIAAQDRRFKSDREKLNSLKHDHEAVKEVARERYYMKTVNEDIFIIEDDEDE
ncbi:MAG: septum formation initiator family protein [Prevotellaceae bacterium]|nr:septum formation initiator family protein [Candidatus Minthosoma caballi]